MIFVVNLTGFLFRKAMIYLNVTFSNYPIIKIKNKNWTECCEKCWLCHKPSTNALTLELEFE